MDEMDKTFPLCQPLPCNPAAESAIQPLIWCFENISSYMVYFPEELFFSLTPIRTEVRGYA